MGDTLWIFDSVGYSSRPTLGNTQEGEVFQPEVIYDRFQVSKLCLQRKVNPVPVGQTYTMLVIKHHSMVACQSLME
jgi:hypothetical protein